MKRLFCAHRGVSDLMPENTLPSFAAALALGADEIEFDIWLTKDKKLIVSHDDTLDRISNGKGKICDRTLDEIKALKIGADRGWELPFCTPEEIFEQFANKIAFNIHVKEIGENGFVINELAGLIEKYNAHRFCYFAGITSELEWMEKIAPEIPRASIQLPGYPDALEVAQRYKCERIQLWNGMFDKNYIDKIHANGMICNLFHAEGSEEYERYFGMGIEVLLTNRMDLAAKYKKEKPEMFA